METTRLASLSCRRTAQACGTLIVVVGVAALAGWATGRPFLLGLRANYIPMAPNAALAFIVLGLGLFAVVGGGAWGRRYAVVGAVLVGVVGILRLGEYVFGVGFAVDRWFIPVPGGQFGIAPIGKMSRSDSPKIMLLFSSLNWRFAFRRREIRLRLEKAHPIYDPARKFLTDARRIASMGRYR